MSGSKVRVVKCGQHIAAPSEAVGLKMLAGQME